MRVAHLFFAHCAANAYVMKDVIKTLFSNPEVIKPPLFVYTRWSVEFPWGRKMTRQVSAGYWKNADRQGFQPTWVDEKTFFLEEYNQEIKKWNRVIPKPKPPKHRTPWYRP